LPELALDLLLGEEHPLDVPLVVLGKGSHRIGGCVVRVGQGDRTFHLAFPFHPRLSGEGRERETYSLSLVAFKPSPRSRRLPPRPAARSRIASIRSRVGGPPQRRIDSRTTRAASALGSESRATHGSRTPSGTSSTSSAIAGRACRASSRASSRSSAAV